MRIVIAGGGTGGHVFPGIAVAEEIRTRDETAEIMFIGTEHGIESRVVPKEGYPIKFLRAEGIVGKSFLKKITASFRMVFSIYESYRMLKKLKPDIVIGVGGYASFPPVLAAYILSLPTMILEQNSVPGLANRVLGKFADAVSVTYQESMSFFLTGKTFFTGNPVRRGIFKGSREAAYNLFSLDPGKFTIFIFGGSLGAKSINMGMKDALNYLFDIREDIQFLHQTGAGDYEEMREAYRKGGFKGTVAAFIYQMAEAYAAADIVVSRAGATTLAEITALGKPAILIPYPYAAGHHQEFNAKKLMEMGAAMVIVDGELKGEYLAQNIRELFKNEIIRNDMKKHSIALGSPDALQRVVDIALSLTRGNKRFNRGKDV